MLDTNVLISALGWGGPPETCFRFVLRTQAINFTSEDLLEELSTALHYPRLEITEVERERFVDLVTSVSIVLEPEIDIGRIEEDPDDNKVLECALVADADFIVSGDRHLKQLGTFQETEIVPPSEFADRFR